MYAIIQDGGHQYKVEKGATVRFDRKSALKQGASVEFAHVLAYHDGQALKLGKPRVDGVKVLGEVVGDARGPKLRVYKYARRKGWKNTTGHKQKYTLVKITDIVSA